MDFFVGDFKSWFESYARGKLFRLWRKGEDDNPNCEYVYFQQAICLGGNSWMIGYCVYDERYPDNMYPSMDWDFLTDIEFTFYPNDAED